MAAGAGEPRPLCAPKPLPPGKRLAPPLARSFPASFLPSFPPSRLPPTRQPPPGQARRHRPSTFTPRRHHSPSNQSLEAAPDKAQDSTEACRAARGGVRPQGPLAFLPLPSSRRAQPLKWAFTDRTALS